MVAKLKQKVFLSVKWIAILGLAQKLISVGTTIILARLLRPEDFGLFALAFVLIEALELFKSLGIDHALIRMKDDSNFAKAANTAFIIIPIFALFIFAVLYIIAPFGAKLLGNNSLTSIVRVLGLYFIFGCFGRIPDAILSRNMLFRQKSIIEIVARFVYSICAIILAFLGCGVWSLVIAYLVRVAIKICSYWYTAKWRPKLEFDKKLALEMFHYGKYIIARSIVRFFKKNIDKLLIGRLLGVTQLGFYFLAFNISKFPSAFLIDRASRVLFPAFSKMQNDKEYFSEVFLRVVKFISILAIPFGIGLFLIGGDFFRIAYGEKWIPAIGVLKILAFAGILQAIDDPIGPALLAAGKSKISFQVNFIQVALFLVFLFPATYYFKIIGAGYAVLLSGIIAFIIRFKRIKEVLQFTYQDLLNSLKPACVSTIFMFLFIVFIKSAVFNAGLTTIVSFAITVLLAIAVYGISIILLDRNAVRELKQLALQK